MSCSFCASILADLLAAKVAAGVGGRGRANPHMGSRMCTGLMAWVAWLMSCIALAHCAFVLGVVTKSPWQLTCAAS